jgi:ribosomal protein S18 acetylase RimI-like enzyme
VLRPVTAHDTSSVVDLVVAAGMFSREDAQFLHEALLPGDDGTTCLVEDADEAGLASVVLYRPEEAADRVYDLTMIAVRPDLQGGGRGARLVRHAEEDLRRRRQRLLVVRTSGTPRYDRTRAFYRSLGYTEHVPVADYWTDGDDLVLYTTHL